MSLLRIAVKDSTGTILAQEEHAESVNLVYNQPYNEGDTITLSAPHDSYLIIKLDDVLESSFVYFTGDDYVYTIPFGEKRFSYNPKSFTGEVHLLCARFATDAEKAMHKNLAFNSHDTATNTVCFPHASANIETRGESVFAARNAIDGNCANTSHGNWPYESWGINRDPNAELYLDFGRKVCIDTLVLVTRADFPHDNYWTSVEVVFNNGEEHAAQTFTMKKSVDPHVWHFDPRIVTGLTLRKLIKDESNPSPFPALTQIQVFGSEAQ